jgi:hypothetical protein
MRTDAKTELEKTLLDSLADLADAVDEGIAPESRSERLDTAFEDAMCVLFPEEEDNK